MMPGSGRVADPGLAGTAPGTGEIIMAPVSVCHQVSTIGQRSRPMFLRYQIHASGLIGSPTVPRRRKLERSCFAGQTSPHLMKARMAVGAVYKMFTLYLSTMAQNRSGSGWFGAPSYMRVVAPLSRGPY